MCAAVYDAPFSISVYFNNRGRQWGPNVSLCFSASTYTNVWITLFGGKPQNSLRGHKKNPQTLDYHENAGGPNGPEYSKQSYEGSFNVIIFIKAQDSISAFEMMLIDGVCQWVHRYLECLVGRFSVSSWKFGQICKFPIGLISKTWVLSLCVHSDERWGPSEMSSPLAPFIKPHQRDHLPKLFYLFNLSNGEIIWGNFFF